jgi:hypothetical protein
MASTRGFGVAHQENRGVGYEAFNRTTLLLKMCQMGSVVFDRIMIIFITQNVPVHQSTRFDTLMPQSLDEEQLSRNSFSFVDDTPFKY